MARKYNLDGSYTVRNSEGATKIFPDGKKFYMNVAGQKALQEYYKSNGFNRVQTGTTTRREKYYTGPPKAGGSGWQYKTVETPTYGYLPSKPFQAVAPKPAPPAPQPYTPQEIQGLISDTIAKAAPAPAPAPPPPPPPAQVMFSSPTLVGQSPLQLSPASTTPTKVSPFQRRSSAANLKINQSLNV